MLNPFRVDFLGGFDPGWRALRLPWAGVERFQRSPLREVGQQSVMIFCKRSGRWSAANTELFAAGRKKRDRQVFARASLRLHQSLFCLVFRVF